MNILEFDNRLEAILVRWDNVEASIKSAELFQGKVTVPAINELRYAGRQIIRAISQSRNLADRDVYDKALYNAEQCLTNADHDIADSLVMFIGRRIDDLNARFGGLSIERAYPPYRELRSAIRECQKKIEQARKDSEKRHELYESLKKNYLPRLMAGYKDLFDAELFMAVEVEKYKSEITKQKLTIYTLAGALLLASVLALTLVAYIFYIKFQ